MNTEQPFSSESRHAELATPDRTERAFHLFVMQAERELGRPVSLTGDAYDFFANGDTVAEFVAEERAIEDRNEAAYDRQQQSLMESGGPDDSAYRRDMIDAGRGHLLR